MLIKTMSNEVVEVVEVSEVSELVGVVELNDRVESLLAKVKSLEARLNDLSPPSHPSAVRPDGMSPFDVKKRIEALESKNDTYYKNWDCASTERYGEIVIGYSYVKKQYDDAMFDGIYYIVPKMISLRKLTMVSSNGSALDGGLTLLPDLSKIKNVSVNEMHICAGFDFIPYLDNFHCLTRLEIVDHPLRPELNRDYYKKQQIREYCENWNIQLICDFAAPLQPLQRLQPLHPLSRLPVDTDTVSYNCERVNRDIKEFQLTDAHVGNANVRSLDPFIGIYHMIPQLTSLEKLTIITNDEKRGNVILTMLPNVRMIRNESLIELRICDECEYIPYLASFPSLKRLEIVSRQGGMAVQPRYKNIAESRDAFQRIPARKQKIKDYCAENGIELVSTIN